MIFAALQAVVCVELKARIKSWMIDWRESNGEKATQAILLISNKVFYSKLKINKVLINSGYEAWCLQESSGRRPIYVQP